MQQKATQASQLQQLPTCFAKRAEYREREKEKLAASAGSNDPRAASAQQWDREQQSTGRLGNQTSQPRSRRRRIDQRLVEIQRQQVEIQRVYRSIVVEVGMHPVRI